MSEASSATAALTRATGGFARTGSRAVAGVRSSPRLLAALFAGGLLVSAFTIRQGIDPFDEGLVLQAAHRVAVGQVPYRDFLWAYGPAQPYLLALLAKLLGPSLLQWRILRSLTDAGVALVAYVLVRRRAGRPVALAVWIAVAGEMAEPRSANPFAAAWLAVLLALALATGRRDGKGRPVAAALLTGVAAAFRIDFGLYALAACAVALAAGGGLRTALRFLAVCVVLTAVVYAPFAVIDGPAALYHALIGTSLHTRAYWTLPFPLRFHSVPGDGTAQNVKHLIDFYVPLVLVVAAAVAAVGVLAVAWAERRVPALEAGLLVLAAGSLSYLLSRTDAFHAQALFVVIAVLLGLLAARARTLVGPLRWPARIVALVLLAPLIVHSAANRISAAVKPPVLRTLTLPVADGVQAPPAEARAIERMVALVQARVAPGGAIWVAARRSDLIRSGNPLVYVLTQRENPTPEDFGLETPAAAQARIVAELTRARPRMIVRWTDPYSSSREPNLRGRSSGVRTLDTWIGAHYRLLSRLYHYDVLVRR